MTFFRVTVLSTSYDRVVARRRGLREEILPDLLSGQDRAVGEFDGLDRPLRRLADGDGIAP